MNGWLLAAASLLACGVGPAAWAVAAGRPQRRVVAQNLATSLVTLTLLLLAQGYERPAYLDLALVLALLGPVGTLVYARLLAGELRDDPPRGRLTTAVTVAATVGVVVAMEVAAGSGRAAVKLLVIGALLIGGNIVAARALGAPAPGAVHHG